MPHDFKAFPELSNKQLEEMPFDSPHPQITSDFFAEVVKVHDGDTITLRVPWRDFNFPLRFLGIDSLEMNENGIIARDWLRNKIDGASVYISINPDNRVDKYGRLLGRVIYSGMDVGEEEIYLGLAKPFERRYEDRLPNINKELDIKKWF